MNHLKKQHGITMMGLLFVGIFLAVVGLVALKLLPFYQEYSGVVRSLEQLKDVPNIKQSSEADIKSQLLNKFYLNDVRDIKPANFEQHVVIEPFENSYVLKVDYIREASLFMNVYIVAKFKQEFKL